MAERYALVRSLAGQGMGQAEIHAQMREMGVFPPVAEPAGELPESIGVGTRFRQGVRGLSEATAEGVGYLVGGERGEAITAAGERAFGLTEEEQATREVVDADRSFMREVGDTIVEGAIPSFAAITAAGYAGAKAGGALGALAGPTGAVAGATLGAVAGSIAAAFPMSVSSALDAARENGLNPDDPEVRSKVAATGLARTALEVIVPTRIARMLERPATQMARQALSRAGARGAGINATLEAAAEVSGEILEAVVFDPQLNGSLSDEEREQILPYAIERYGRQLAVAALAGGAVGGAAGGAAGTYEQNRANAMRQQDVESLRTAAETGGLDVDTLRAAAADPERVPALAAAARELGAVQRDVRQAQQIVEAATATGNQDQIDAAQASFTAATARANEVYDRVMQPLGAKTTAQIETEAAARAEVDRDYLVTQGIFQPEDAAGLGREDAAGYAQQVREAEEAAQAARDALQDPANYTEERKAAARREVQEAEARVQQARDDVLIRSGKATQESLVADRKAQEERAGYDAAVERQYQRRFARLEGNPDAMRAEAEAVLDQNRADPDKGLKAEITKLEKKLDAATTVEQIDAIEQQIADKQSRMGRRAPIVAAAERAIERLGPRQADGEAQGVSPAPQGQPAAPDATPVTATPQTTEPASAGAVPQVEGQVEPASQPAVPAPPPPEPAAPVEPRLPEDLRRAAPRYKTDRVQFANDIDKAAYVTAQAKPSRRDADYLRFVQEATGMTPEQVRAHGARVRGAIAATPATDGVRRLQPVDRTPEPTPPPAPEAEATATPEPSNIVMTRDGEQVIFTDPDTGASLVGYDFDDYRPGSFQADVTEVPEAARRQGVSQRLHDAAIDYAESRGGRFLSGYELTPDGMAFYRGLAAKGYRVRRTDLPNGEQAFEVRKPNAEPEPATAPAPDAAPIAPRTRAEAASRQEAEVDTQVRQRELDAQRQAQAPVEFTPQHRTGPQQYTDGLDLLGRRNVTRDRARKFVLEQGGRTGHEWSVAFDPETGEVLGAGTNGHASMVQISNAAWQRLIDGRPVEIVHNHPTGTTLSGADLQYLARFPTMTVVAVGGNGTVYEAKAGRNIANVGDLSTFGPRIENTKRTAARAFDAHAMDNGLVDASRSPEQRQQDFIAFYPGVSRAVNRALSNAGVIRYVERGRKAVIPTKEAQAYERASDAARDAVQRLLSVQPGGPDAGGTGGRSGDVQRPGAARAGRSRRARSDLGDQDVVGPGDSDGPGRGSLREDAGGDLRGDGAGRYAIAATEPLPDAPTVRGATGPDTHLVGAAERYARDNGIDLRRQAEFVQVDPERAARIADEYDRMVHAPDDPAVREAYDDLIRQTVAQYRALERDGYQFYFYDPDGVDPYSGQQGGFSNPWNAMRDLRANRRMAVFPTSDGFGTSDADVSGNPLLAATEVRWAWGSPDGPLRPVTANDLFRAVHDAFGHGLEGAGFRARGEENAWQAHVRLFTGPAVGAITSETRGQNSWLNYGPHGETNRTASVEDTVFADQKTGLMPEWTWTEGRANDMSAPGFAEASFPDVVAQDVRSGMGVGNQYRNWHDFSADLPGTMDAQAAVAEVRRRGADGFEHAVITREDGVVLGAGTNRAPNAVAASTEAAKYHRNDIAPVRFTHNHPIPTPLSMGDMGLLFTAESPHTIVAVLPDGSQEVARLTPAARAMSFADRQDALNRAFEAVFPRTRLPDATDMDQAIYRAHALNRALDEAGLIEYTPGFPDPVDPQMRTAISEGVSRVQDAYPSLRDAADTGRPGEQGRRPEATGDDLGPQGVRPERSDAAVTEAVPAADREGLTGFEETNPLAALPDAMRDDPAIIAAAQRFVDARARAQRLVEVPAWMDARDPGTRALQAAVDFARAPASNVRKAALEFERQFVNAFVPVREKEMATRGRLATGLDSAYKAAEVAVNDPGRNESLLYYGAASIDPQMGFRPKEGTIGLRPMLEKLGQGQQVQDWLSFMAAKRAQEIRAKGLKTPLTDADIKKGLDLGKGNKLFAEVAADWKRYNDANVDFLVDTGRITPALAKALKADAAYIPFYRSDQTLNDTPELLSNDDMFTASRGGIFARNPGIKKLTGGDTTKIDHIVFNMIRNSQAMVSAGMRNKAANQIFDLMQEAGEATLQPATRVNEDGSVTKVAKPEGSVTMWRDGKEFHVVPTDRDAQVMFAALGALDPVRLNAITEAMAKIGSFFRQSITLSPGFIVRNMQRDALSTGVLFGGRNLTFKNNMLRGAWESYHSGASRQAFTAASGMGDFRFGGGDIGFGKNDVLVSLGLQKKTFGYRWRQLVGAMERVGTASELSNRIAIYNSLVESGVRPDEAAYQSLTITNYSRRGASQTLRVVLPLVPFMNARIQGMARIYEDFVTTKKGSKERQAAVRKLALGGAVMTMFSGALWAWNNRDDEAREEYMSQPLHRRLNYHMLAVGDRKFFIPKAFEIGTMFGTVPEIAMNAAAGDTSELGSAVVQTIGNTFGLNAIPQAVLPAFEVTANYSFFTGRAVEGQRLQSLPRAERINPQTAALAVALGQSGLGRFTGMSPVQVEHLLQGYGGIAYSMLAMGVDTIAGEIGLLPTRPEGVFGSTPGIAQFAEAAFGSQVRRREGDPSNRWVEEFYDTRAAVIQVFRAARAAAERGDIERARQLLGGADPSVTAEVHRFVNQAASQMTQLNQAMRDTREDRDMSAAEKTRRLTKLIEARNQISMRVMQIVREQEAAQDVDFRRIARQ